MSTIHAFHPGLYSNPLSNSIFDKINNFLFKFICTITILIFRFFIIGNKSNSIHFGCCSFDMRKVHGPHLLIIQIFYWQIGESSSICELDSCQINFFPNVIIVNVIFSPLFFPRLSLKGNGKRCWHLHRLRNREIRSCFLIKKPKDMVFHINRSASELNSCQVI